MEIATKKDAEAIELTILNYFNRLGVDFNRYLEKAPEKYHDKDVFKVIRFIRPTKEVLDIPITKKQYQRWKAVKPKLKNE